MDIGLLNVDVASGIVTGESDVVSGGVSLRTHTHTKVMPGPALTGPPAC